MADEDVTLYWSFRSPYSWLAFHRLGAALRGLPVTLRLVPVYPPPDGPDGSSLMREKIPYLLVDVGRIAEAYGLALRPPPGIDTDWARPHAAFLFADAEGRGLEFARAGFAARFQQGRDVAQDATLTEMAHAAGLDAARVLAAADDPGLQRRVQEGITRARAAGLFGVPSFVYRGKMFWGNDRIEWLLRAIRQDAGLPVPDLRADPLAPPAG